MNFSLFALQILQQMSFFFTVKYLKGEIFNCVTFNTSLLILSDMLNAGDRVIKRPGM